MRASSGYGAPKKLCDWKLKNWSVALKAPWKITHLEQQGKSENGCRNRELIQDPLPATIAALNACRDFKDVESARKIHINAVEGDEGSNRYVASILIDLYAKCGCLEDARRVFDKTLCRNSFPWTILIQGYVEQGAAEMALELFERMPKEDFSHSNVCKAFVAAVKACCSIAVKEASGEIDGKPVKIQSLGKGMELHSEVERADGCYANIFIANVLIDMYAKCGSMIDARRVFDRMANRDVVSWTSLILGYVDNGEARLALDMFFCMQPEGCDPDSRAFLSALKACSVLATREEGREFSGKLIKVQALEKGMEVHSQAAERGLSSDMFLASTLVDMYAKCGSMEDSRRIFDSMQRPDVVSWTALMLGYAESGEGEVALDLFQRMQRTGCAPDSTTLAAVVKACGSAVNLKTGKSFHAYVCRCGLDDDMRISNCLLDLYGKCGSMVDAEIFFSSLATRNSVTWTALIAGYGRQGDTKHVFRLAREMQEEGLQADGVTFISILTACSHAGLIEKAKQCFQAMCSSKYRITPDIQHYACMIDILTRANELDAALEMVRSMPFRANTLVWRTILGACRKWKNATVGRVAFEALLKLDNKNAAHYALMANIYGSLGMWEEQSEVEEIQTKLQTIQ